MLLLFSINSEKLKPCKHFYVHLGMWRHIVLTGVAIFSIGMLFAQSKKHFTVNNTGRCKKVVLNYSSSSGTCYLGPTQKPDLFSVYGNKDIDEYNHYFDQKIRDNVCTIDLKIEDKSTESFSQSISYKMFRKSKDFNESLWKVYLSEDKSYRLNLNYGIGEAYIDLSGLSIKHLRINTGSADVHVGYLSGIGNPIIMDTLKITVDLGSLQIRKGTLSNAKVIIAEVGFGNAYLDLSGKPDISSYINASVGAGNLEVVVPRTGTGVKVIIHQSLLCQVKLSKSFTETDTDIFVNEYYEEGAAGQLVFDVDVSLGNIIFKDKK